MSDAPAKPRDKTPERNQPQQDPASKKAQGEVAQWRTQHNRIIPEQKGRQASNLSPIQITGQIKPQDRNRQPQNKGNTPPKKDEPLASQAAPKRDPKKPDAPNAGSVTFKPKQNIEGSTAQKYTADRPAVQRVKENTNLQGATFKSSSQPKAQGTQSQAATASANRLSSEAKKTVTQGGPIQRDVTPRNPQIQIVDSKKPKGEQVMAQGSLPKAQPAKVNEYKAKLQEKSGRGPESPSKGQTPPPQQPRK